MSIFNKLRFREKREAKRLAELEQACYDEILGVLQKHNCKLEPKLQVTPYGILPDLVISALPTQPANGPTPTGAPSGAETTPADAGKTQEAKDEGATAQA